MIRPLIKRAVYILLIAITDRPPFDRRLEHRFASVYIYGHFFVCTVLPPSHYAALTENFMFTILL